MQYSAMGLRNDEQTTYVSSGHWVPQLRETTIKKTRKKKNDQDNEPEIQRQGGRDSSRKALLRIRRSEGLHPQSKGRPARRRRHRAHKV